MKQMLKRQMKGVPEAEQDKMIGMIEQNPDFFQNIAVQIQEKMKNGKSQMDATMEVMRANEEEMRKVMSK